MALCGRKRHNTASLNRKTATNDERLKETEANFKASDRHLPHVVGQGSKIHPKVSLRIVHRKENEGFGFT